jgi:hypothetical protein
VQYPTNIPDSSDFSSHPSKLNHSCLPMQRSFKWFLIFVNVRMCGRAYPLLGVFGVTRENLFLPVNAVLGCNTRSQLKLHGLGGANLSSEKLPSVRRAQWHMLKTLY